MGKRERAREREREQDNEITRLWNLVQAHSVQNAQTRARLRDTQAALDLLQASHDEELAAVQRENNALKAKHAVYKMQLATAEDELDDMRTVVNELADKVAQNHDYGVWPTGKMRISTFLDPVTPSRVPQTADDADALSYAAAIINRLLATTKAQEKDITLLQREKAVLHAQLALRDVAEAEIDLGLGLDLRDFPDAVIMNDDEAMEVLEDNRATQRGLEMEVEGLRRRVAQLQLGRTSPDAAAFVPPPPIASGSGLQPPPAPAPPQQVDAFHAERETLLRMIDAAKADQPPPPEDLLDINDGEMSMELATPLFPTSLLSPPFPPPDGS
ncbi:hypothetical protein BDZ89DRAFT_1138211 [Hymenopellis radicata]|nr:hypothetical protein BDZ89DRAFT_1138211 [Hymenopellis radicata]